MSLTQTNKLTANEAAHLLRELREWRKNLLLYAKTPHERIEKLDIIIEKIENLYDA